MADILISATTQDRDTAERLSRLFEARGLSVDWMPLDPVEPGNRAGIVRRRAGARVTLALWSRHAVNDAQVLEDAREALRRGSLLTARLEDILPPPEFRANSTISLAGWDGADSHIQAGRLLTETAKLLERTSTRPALAQATARLTRSTRGTATAALRPNPAYVAAPVQAAPVASPTQAAAASIAPEVKSATAIAPAALLQPDATPSPEIAKAAETAPVETPSETLALSPAPVKTVGEAAEEKLEARPAPVAFAGEAANDALPLRPANVGIAESAPPKIETEPTYQTFTFEPEPRIDVEPETPVEAPIASTPAAAAVVAASATTVARVIKPVEDAPKKPVEQPVRAEAPRPQKQKPKTGAPAPDRKYFFKEPRDRTERDDHNHYVAIILGVIASVSLLAFWLEQRPQDFAAPGAPRPAISATAPPEVEREVVQLESAPPEVAIPEIAIGSDLPLIEPAPVAPQVETAAPAPSAPATETPPAPPVFAEAPKAEQPVAAPAAPKAQVKSTPPATPKKLAKAAPPAAEPKVQDFAEALPVRKAAPAKPKASAPAGIKPKRLAEVGRALDARAAAPAQANTSQTIAALAGAPAAKPAAAQNADLFDPQPSLTLLRLSQSEHAFHLPGLAPTLLGAWTPGPDAPAPLLNAPISEAEWNAAPARTLAQSALISGAYKDHLVKAQAGDRRAMLTLGLMRQTGIGQAQDDARAFAWLRRSALAGEPRALAEIGAYYAAGIAAPRDDARAARNFDRSATLGAAAGKTAVGWALATGRGLPADAVAARAAFEDAAKSGDPLAMLNLGRMQADGLGGEKDLIAAKASYAKAADQGFAPAQYALGVLLLMDMPAADAENAAARTYAETLAALRVQQAAAQGYPPAQDLLGALYLNGIGVAQDNAMARAWLARVARP